MAKKNLGYKGETIVDTITGLTFEINDAYYENGQRMFKIGEGKDSFTIPDSENFMIVTKDEFIANGKLEDYLKLGSDEAFLDAVASKMAYPDGSKNISLRQVYSTNYKNAEGEIDRSVNIGVKYESFKKDVKKLDNLLINKFGEKGISSEKAVQLRMDGLKELFLKYDIGRDVITYKNYETTHNYKDAFAKTNDDIRLNKSMSEIACQELKISTIKNEMENIKSRHFENLGKGAMMGAIGIGLGAIGFAPLGVALCGRGVIKALSSFFKTYGNKLEKGYYKELEKELKNAENKLKRIETEKVTKENEVKSLENKNNKLEKNIERQENRLNEAKKELEKSDLSEKEKSKIENKINKIEKDIEKNKTEVEGNKNKISSLKYDIALIEGEKKAIEKSINDRKSDYETDEENSEEDEDIENENSEEDDNDSKEKEDESKDKKESENKKDESEKSDEKKFKDKTEKDKAVAKIKDKIMSLENKLDRQKDRLAGAKEDYKTAKNNTERAKYERLINNIQGDIDKYKVELKGNRENLKEILNTPIEGEEASEKQPENNTEKPNEQQEENKAEQNNETKESEEPTEDTDKENITEKPENSEEFVKESDKSDKNSTEEPNSNEEFEGDSNGDDVNSNNSNDAFEEFEEPETNVSTEGLTEKPNSKDEINSRINKMEKAIQNEKITYRERIFGFNLEKASLTNNGDNCSMKEINDKTLVLEVIPKDMVDADNGAKKEIEIKASNPDKPGKLDTVSSDKISLKFKGDVIDNRINLNCDNVADNIGKSITSGGKYDNKLVEININNPDGTITTYDKDNNKITQDVADSIIDLIGLNAFEKTADMFSIENESEKDVENKTESTEDNNETENDNADATNDAKEAEQNINAEQEGTQAENSANDINQDLSTNEAEQSLQNVQPQENEDSQENIDNTNNQTEIPNNNDYDDYDLDRSE